LFEITDISGVVMVLKLLQLFDQFSFIHKILAYVKDKWFNLQTCVTKLNFNVSCNSLAVLEPFDGQCFGHALSKPIIMLPLMKKQFMGCITKT